MGYMICLYLLKTCTLLIIPIVIILIKISSNMVAENVLQNY